MKRRRNPLIAREGNLFLLAAAVLAVVVVNLWGVAFVALPVILLVILFLIFRDPDRPVPAVPLGVVSPTDGVVVEVGVTDRGILGNESHRIVIRIDTLGIYTARCPIEGKIMDLHGEPLERPAVNDKNGLWVQSDEGDDVVLQFHGHRFGLAPHAFLRYGERVGQGQRCAYLRLTREAEVQLPIASLVLVKAGQRVTAGTDVLAKLPHP